jgi:hypothetical protein
MPFIKDVGPVSAKVIVALAALGPNESAPPVRVKDVAFNSLTWRVPALTLMLPLKALLLPVSRSEEVALL